MINRLSLYRGVLAGVMSLACARGGAAADNMPVPPALSADVPMPSAAVKFNPPAESVLPTGDFGKSVKLGEQIFTHTGEFAGKYIGNSLNCASCHLDAGRKPNSSPLWAAYPLYPAYRSKNGHVNSFAERLQGCFRYSMNGKAPPLGDPVLVALETYAYWLAKGAPVGEKLSGQGYPKLPAPAQQPDYARGSVVYAQHCALCHATDGQGQSSGGKTVFPPLWGSHSFNWGAGMGEIQNAAGFIKANMPLGLGGTLTDQQAWDVATFMDSQERPQDPRFTRSVEATRAAFHDTPQSMYGKKVNGRILGAP
jgi:thiosulfate dehydrogenase